jgi:hypothetical protein
LASHPGGTKRELNPPNIRSDGFGLLRYICKGITIILSLCRGTGGQFLTERVRIDAIELLDVRLSADRTRLVLRLRDQTGQSVSLSLPTACLNTVLTAIPQQVENGTVHSLDTWTMGPGENGQDLVLTLRTPQGLAISFIAKPFQVEAMATIATYGRAHPTTAKSIH